jgi:ribose transport system substrate-binding protein
MHLRFWAALLAWLTLFSIGCGDRAGSGVKRIVFLNNTNSPFWDACREGIEEAERELKLNDAGLEAMMEVNDGTPSGQIEKLRQFRSQPDIVAVAISPIVADNAAIAQELRELRKQGVAVICVDNDIAPDLRDSRQFYIGTDNVKGGRQLGKCATALRPEGGEYVQFVGRTGAQNALERMDGFSDEVGEKFVEKARMADEANRSKARDNVRDAITNFPELDILVGIWSYNAPAIVDVVKEKNLPDLTVVTFDAEKLAVDAMAEGHIDAMVVQNPFDMGYQLVKLLKALHEKNDTTVKEMFPNQDKEGGDIYETGLKVVIPNQESPVKQVQFDQGTEVLTLDEFKKWLAKYNLESS